MRVLLVKLSSLGDIIHTLPAIEDARQHDPEIRFDWIVESAFSDIPGLHPAVDRVIPIQERYWRHHWRKTRSVRYRFFADLKTHKYDVVLDAQGLIKSALVAFRAQGVRYGLDFRSAWEPVASLVYQRRVHVDRHQHAIVRMRQLFARVLGYSAPESTPIYGLDMSRLSPSRLKGDLMFFHGTTWVHKHWPEEYWRSLALECGARGWRILLPWGNELEKQRAIRIAKDCPEARVLPKLSLMDLARIMTGVRAVVGVDSGLSHLAASLDVPSITLYGPTNPELTGTLGDRQLHFRSDFPCAPCVNRKCRFPQNGNIWPPCFNDMTPKNVIAALQQLLE